MVRHSPARVVAIRPSATATRRARRQVDELVASAAEELAAVQGGDLVQIHGAVIDVLRAVRIVVAFGLDLDDREVVA